RVCDGLHAKAGRTTRLRATLAPRSAVRVMWAASGRWESFTRRLRARWASTLDRSSRSRPSGQEG
ncbi:hypothetical protein G3I40_45290, partial [Streptomyces sp. SID14478]|uniref:hypothetical protein n=1 Tax=Streptomyces sp. SID14478 TaxID=2706073 RepID=UPI0013DFE7D3